MKLWKSKKCNNNNNSGAGNSSSGSTISCVPGKTSSLNKASDAKVDTTTTSSTTISGKSPSFKLLDKKKKSKKCLFLMQQYSINSIKAINKTAHGVNSGRVIFFSCLQKQAPYLPFVCLFALPNARFRNHSFYYIAYKHHRDYSSVSPNPFQDSVDIGRDTLTLILTHTN